MLESVRLLFYLSGHGYGHATRMAEVMRCVLARRPDARIEARSSAPSWLFPEQVRCAHAEIDSGIAESADSLHILARDSASRLENLLARRDSQLLTEVGIIRDLQPQCIVSDIPFLAGDLAEAAGVPCIGISNFTWDWIYEPHLSGDPHWPEWDAVIRSGYERFTALWRLPFAQEQHLESFSEVIDIPLVAPQSIREREEILGELAIQSDPRPKVLIAMRAGVPEPIIQAAIEAAPDILFLHAKPCRVAAPNLIVPRGVSPSFHDLVRACDAVLSKPGYSTVAQCVAERKSLLFVPREGFREDAISLAQASRYVPIRRLPLELFLQGKWAEDLLLLLAEPFPGTSMRSDGAEICAERLIACTN
jgi:hypothetical protein